MADPKGPLLQKKQFIEENYKWLTKRLRSGNPFGGGKTRNITKLSIQNSKPRRSRNKGSQKSSKKRSQKAGGRRRSFKSQRRASLKFNKNKIQSHTYSHSTHVMALITEAI